MVRVGIAQVDITPDRPVWLTGYGNRDHRSEGVYQALRAGALLLQGDADAALILTADVIGYGPAFAAAARASISLATGLLPRQIILTATHTHCAPFFTPWIMPGAMEPGYAAFLERQLLTCAVAACGNVQPAAVACSRGTSTFGVNRRLPDDDGGVRFAPNPDGPMDRDLDTLWLATAAGTPLGSLTVYGCHPTSLGGYLIGGDYPGFLCRALERETAAPALFATGCGGNIRPWYREPGYPGFARPTVPQVEAAGGELATAALASRAEARSVTADALRVAHTTHALAYRQLPTAAELEQTAAEPPDEFHARWANQLLSQLATGPLPATCPHEIQVLTLGPDLCLVFLGGEVLTEIGIRLKAELDWGTTMVAAYTNGLIAYIPGAETYPRGGYEVDRSFLYFERPAPLARDSEERIVTATRELADTLR